MSEALATNLRKELEEMSLKENQLRARVNQLKQMVEEKKKRLESMAKLEQEEAALLALLK